MELMLLFEMNRLGLSGSRRGRFFVFGDSLPFPFKAETGIDILPVLGLEESLKFAKPRIEGRNINARKMNGFPGGMMTIIMLGAAMNVQRTTTPFPPFFVFVVGMVPKQTNTRR